MLRSSTIVKYLAHGYLLHSFLSPFSNKRQDQYGGSLENRMRFPRQVVKTILEAVNVPVTIRISADEFLDDGLSLKKARNMQIAAARWHLRY